MFNILASAVGIWVWVPTIKLTLPSNSSKSVHHVVIGEVIGIHINDDALSDGKVDWLKIQPLARLGYMDYTYVNKVFTMKGPKGEEFRPGQIGEHIDSKHWKRVKGEWDMFKRKEKVWTIKNQEKIIDEYYTDKHLKTDLFPKKNKRAVLKQSKTIIALDFDKLSSNVDKGKKKDLPEKHKISLFHIGKMKDDLVSLGYEDDVFSYPGLDFGGLTNYKQKLGKKN